MEKNLAGKTLNDEVRVADSTQRQFIEARFSLSNNCSKRGNDESGSSLLGLLPLYDG
jgi:hypothetical protein